MFVFRILGWVAVFLALIIFGYDLWRWLIDGEGFRLISAGELWFTVNREGALLVQPAIERHAWPWLWTWVVEPVWLFPASLSFLILGVVLLFLFRARPKRTYA